MSSVYLLQYEKEASQVKKKKKRKYLPTVLFIALA